MATIIGQDNILRSERIAGGILPKVLNSFDMVAIFIAIVLWIPNAAVMTGAGPAAYVYWVLGFITFLIPGAIVTGQLGLMFPGEGSIYVWTTRAFGNFIGFLGGFCAWWPGVLTLIPSGSLVVSLIQKLGMLFGVSLLPDSDSGSQGLVIILVITFSFALSILRFRVTQNLVNVIFLTYGGAILLIGLAGVLWLVTGHHTSANMSFQTGGWLPSSGNLTFYGTVILALLGIEVPLNMGVEIKDTRSITRYLLWGSIVVMLAYLIVTFGVMVAVPLKEQGNLDALVETIKSGFGPIGLILAALVDLIFIGFFIFATAVYNYSYARLIFVSGLDRRLPAVMSKINTNRVPWVAVLVQSAIAALFSAVIYVLAPFVLPGPHAGDISTIIYDILLGPTTIIWCTSMVILFVDVIVIRHKYRDVFARIRLAPDWIFYLCAAVGTVTGTFGIFSIFTAPWTKSVTTAMWDAWIVGITGISFVVAVGIFYIGQKTNESNISDEDIIAEVTR